MGGTSPDVYYIGTDGHVHELMWDDKSKTWKHSDLNTEAEGNPVSNPVNAVPAAG